MTTTGESGPSNGLHQDSLPGQMGACADDFESVLQRIKKAINVKSDTELAKRLGLKQSAVSSAKTRGQIPAAWIVSISKDHGVSADWLLTGGGTPFIEHSTAQEHLIQSEAPQLKDVQIKERTRILRVTPQRRCAEPHDDGDIKSVHHSLDIELLQAAIEAVEDVLDATDRTMQTSKRAELIAAIYDLYEDAEKSIDKSRVLRLVKSAL